MAMEERRGLYSLSADMSALRLDGSSSPPPRYASSLVVTSAESRVKVEEAMKAT